MNDPVRRTLACAAFGTLASLLLAASASSATATLAAPPLPDKWQFTVEAADPIGYFDTPEAVAVAADGSVAIADGGNHRIQRFAPDGSFQAAWGSLGDAEGQFGHPAGLAVAPDGTLVVADSLNHRLQRFSADGKFMATWGGSSGEALDTPWGIAVAPDGSIYATDKARHRVVHFSADGHVIGAWGNEGGAPSQLRSPQAVAVSPDGRTLAVADTGNNRIQRFGADGEFIDLWYAAGPGGRTYAKPQGLAYDAQGNLYVLDTGGDRVQRFGADGVSFDEWGVTGDEDGQFDTPSGIAVASDGTVLVTDAGYHDVQRLTAAGVYVDGWGGYGGGDRRRPVAVAAGSFGAEVFVADRGMNNVEVFSQLPSRGSWIPFIRWGGYGTAPGKYRSIADVIRVQSGDVYTVDAANHRVDVFDHSGRHLSSFGRYGHGPGEFYGPAALALAGNTIWVADSKNHRLQQFTPQGAFLRSVGSLGNGEGQFKRPRGIAVAEDGSLYVADSENGRVVHLAAEGGWLGAWGRNGFGPGDLYRPYDVALDGEGNVWVADSGNHRLQRFWPDGRWRAVYGGAGLEPGQFEWPTSLAIVEDTDIWVADSGNHRVQRLAFDGSGVTAVVQSADDSPANFSRPTGIGFGVGDLNEPPWLYVADSGNGRTHMVNPVTGTATRAWGVQSLSVIDNGLREPEGVASLSDDVIVVADTHNHRLQVRDETGRLVRTVGAKGAGAADFLRPWDVARAPDGTVLVTDNGNSRVRRLGANLDALTNFGRQGKGEGELTGPRGVAVDADGSVVVADTGNYRVARFTAAGKPLPGWPIPPNGVIDPDARTQPPGPSDVAVDADGLIYVADPGFSRVARFDRAGSPLGVIGGPGAGVGRFVAPDSVAFGNSPRLGPGWLFAVSDRQLNRVQVFANHYPTQWRAAYYPNPHFTGTPVTVIMTTSVAIAPQALKQVSEAADDLGGQGWGVRFERLVKLAGAPEHFRLRAEHGGARLWFGDRLVVDEADAPEVRRDATIDVPAGDAVIRLELMGGLEPTPPSALTFEWTPPSSSPPPTIYLALARR